MHYVLTDLISPQLTTHVGESPLHGLQLVIFACVLDAMPQMLQDQSNEEGAVGGRGLDCKNTNRICVITP